MITVRTERWNKHGIGFSIYFDTEEEANSCAAGLGWKAFFILMDKLSPDRFIEGETLQDITLDKIKKWPEVFTDD